MGLLLLFGSSSTLNRTATGGVVIGGAATVRSGVHTEKTWVFTSSLESWVANPGPNQFLDQYVFDGNPAGSLISEIVDQNITDSGYWEWTGTWEQLGVPAGSEVYSIALMGADTRVFAYNKANYATFGPYELRDNSGNLLATLWSGRTATAQEAGWTAEGAQPMKSVPDAQKSSNTSIKIRLNNAMQTNNAGGLGHQVSLLEDNIFIRIVNSPIYSRTGSGNITITGANSGSLTSNRTASGGAVLAGTSTFSLAVSRTGSGSVTMAGAATASMTVTMTASGGVSMEGSSSPGLTIDRTGSGGIVMAGAFGFEPTYSPSPTGGASITGSATTELTTGSSIYVPIHHYGRRRPPRGRLNHGNPHADGLAFYVSDTGAAPRNLVDGKTGVIVDTTLGTWDGATVDGPGLESTSTTGGGFYWGFPALLRGVTDFTIIWYGRLDSWANFGKLVCIPYRQDATWSPPFVALGLSIDSNLLSIEFSDATGTRRFAAPSGTGSLASPPRQPMLLAGVRSGTSFTTYRATHTGFFQGTSTVAGASGQAPNFAAIGVDPNVYIFQRNHTNKAEGVDGVCMMAAIYRRALNASEIQDLWTEPFAPSRPMPTFVSLATDASFSRTGSGGIVLGGDNAPQNVSFSPASSGGILTGGTSSFLWTYSATASGGIVLGGTNVGSLAVSRTGSGGIVMSGTPTIQWTHSTTASGGIVLGGSGSASFVVSRTASGGIILGGTATTNFINSRTASGGIVIGGTATILSDNSRTGSGGIVISGSSAPSLTVSRTGSGGIVLGGSSVAAIAFDRTASGGLIVGGTATTATSFSLAGSGEIRILGAAINPQAVVFNRSASGGIIVSGEADLLRGYLHYPSGGIRISGVRERDADYSANFTATIQSGPITIGGSAAPSLELVLNPTFDLAASGGIVIGGSATPVFEIVLNPTFNLTASGGIVLGGGVSLLSLSASPAPSGGIVIGGSFDVTLTTYPPVGQVFWLARTPIIGMGSL